jgi:branched-chain amino acid transport system ATP-binding protein
VNRYGLARTFERTRLFEGLTVHENMLLARNWRGVPLSVWFMGVSHQADQRADDLLMLLGIDHSRNRLVRDLSTVEQRLLEISMALMSQPSVILLDEITAGIPLATADELKTTLRRLNRDFGLTFLIVEHNMNFVVDLCDRVYVLDHGSIVAEGTPQAMLREPAVADAYFGHE